jgi:hypothetical protein
VEESCDTPMAYVCESNPAPKEICAIAGIFYVCWAGHKDYLTLFVHRSTRYFSRSGDNSFLQKISTDQKFIFRPPMIWLFRSARL